MKKEAAALASKLGVPRAESDVIAHAYVSARLAFMFGDQNARKFGNLQENRSVDIRDSMKDQINNSVGRRIGNLVAAIVSRQPELADRASNMIGDLIAEAYRSGTLATTKADRRVGWLFDQKVDPQLWRPEDDRRIAWAGPSAQFQAYYGVRSTDTPPPRQFGY